MLLDTSVYHYLEETGIWARPEYQGIPYSDGEAQENLLLNIINNVQDRSVFSAELKTHCTDWVTTYHFSSLRSNLLRPLKSLFQPGKQVLEIGAGCGAITRYLGETGCEVLALEGSLRRAAIARARTADQGNVTVVSERFDDFTNSARFDVITLIGVLEYSNLFSQGDDSAVSMLDKIKQRLKPGGKVVIAIENQLGLKYFAGAPEDHLGQPMYGVEGRYTRQQVETYGHQVLKEKLAQVGLGEVETLMPFPDYKLPVSVVTAHGAAARDFNAAIFAAQSVRADMQLPDKLNFVPEMAWPVVFKNGLAAALSNSFLLVAGAKCTPAVAPHLLAFHYSNNRRAPFCKETVFRYRSEKDTTLEVKRYLLSPGEVEENPLIDFKLDGYEKYVDGVSLPKEFIRIVTTPGWEMEHIAVYFRYYISCLQTCLKGEGIHYEEFVQHTVLPPAYLDAIPSNILIDHDNQPRYFEREWLARQGITLGNLVFRAALSLLSQVSFFAPPASGEALTRGAFMRQLFDALSFTSNEQLFEHYLILESELQIYSKGSASYKLDTWYPEHILPGLHALNKANREALKQRQTEQALAEKARLCDSLLVAVQQQAEKSAWAESALAEKTRACKALQASRDAAEKLAQERLEDVRRLQAELQRIRSGKLYRLAGAFSGKKAQ